MAYGSGSGNDDFIKVVAPSPPISDADAQFTATLEQMAKSHEAQMGMQAQIASMLQIQSQMQAQIPTPPILPVQQHPNVGMHVVVQSK